MDFVFVIFQFLILMFSVMIHEISHGSTANMLGDPTAKNEGRLTFNPKNHFDFFGSFLLPLMLFFGSGGRFMFGWAKPVPFNPFNLRNPKRDSGLISASGPLSNILVAIVFGLFIRSIIYFNLLFFSPMIIWFDIIVQINLILAIFNLIPIPPLDGSGILFSILPPKFENFLAPLRRYGLLILILFIFFGFRIISPIINWLHWLIVGAGMG